MSQKVTDEMVDKAIKESNIYPEPDFSEVRNHMEKINRMMRVSDTDMSEKRLIRKTACAVDIKSRMDRDEWIIYEGKLKDLKQ